MSMFCYQCEQTAKGTGCEKVGVCGKKPDVAALQDLVIYQAKGISWLAHQVYNLNEKNESADYFVMEALFTTITNVNFDPERLTALLKHGDSIADNVTEFYLKIAPNANKKSWPAAATFRTSTCDDLVAEGERQCFMDDSIEEDIRSLQQLLTYGLKGLAAYADHAHILGKTDDAIYAYTHEALATILENNSTVDELVALNMKCGEINIRTMEILNQAHIAHYGKPEPATIKVGLKKGPAIVITGHDMLDLENLLKQTEGTGVNIYTHGEMLPAHGYPGLRKYSHLAGHFGTAWQNQQKEFDGVPVAFLFTTNCIQKPKPSYIDNVFTTDLVAWPSVKHIPDQNYSSVIEKAKELGGLAEDNQKGTLTTGFGHDAVLSAADKIIDGVKDGAIKHFFLVGGCDGAKPGRNYYTELVEKTPTDTIILTLACGKFRFNHLDLGDINGIPRLLDIGQCNDAYSAIRIALALSEAFECGVNDLPLSFVLSWYEQKAVVILLSLLHLGIKGIRVGPTLPAFISPNILKFLMENFDLKPIGNAEEDLADMLNIEMV